MSIGISDDHVELAASLRKWAAGVRRPGRGAGRRGRPWGDVRRRSGRPSARWGWPTIGLPEAAGGGGGSVLDVAVALEACAHELVPGPLLGPAVAAALLGDTPLAGELGGGAVVGLVLGDVVWDAPSATHLLLSDGDGWCVVPRTGATIDFALGLDLTRRFGRLREVDRSSAAPVAGRDGRARPAYGPHAGRGRGCRGRPGGASRRPSSTPACASSSGRRSGSSRRSSTCAPRCWRRPSPSPPRRGTSPRSPSRTTSSGRTPPTWPARSPSTARSATRRPASRCSAGSASRSSTTPTSTCAAPPACAACWARPTRSPGRWPSGPRRGYAGGSRSTWTVGTTPCAPTYARWWRRIAALPADRRRAGLVEAGYLTPHWPPPHGLAADAVTQLVIDQELAAAGVERPDLKIGGWAAPTIIAHGNDAQRERFVRPTLLGELTWCQLFSEPGAGSDLASLRTRAEHGRGRLAAHRPEGVDVARPRGRLGDLPGPDGPGRAAAPGDLLLPARHGGPRASTSGRCAS